MTTVIAYGKPRVTICVSYDYQLSITTTMVERLRLPGPRLICTLRLPLPISHSLSTCVLYVLRYIRLLAHGPMTCLNPYSHLPVVDQVHKVVNIDYCLRTVFARRHVLLVVTGVVVSVYPQ